MKKENALMKLGRAVSEYLKGKPVPKKSDRRNQPAHNHKQSKPRCSRHEHYREEQQARNLNVARSQIANPDGTIITVDVYSHQSCHAKRSYKKSERK